MQFNWPGMCKWIPKKSAYMVRFAWDKKKINENTHFPRFYFSKLLKYLFYKTLILIPRHSKWTLQIFFIS